MRAMSGRVYQGIVRVATIVCSEKKGVRHNLTPNARLAIERMDRRNAAFSKSIRDGDDRSK